MNEPSEKISVESFKCGICFELICDPTTLTCGHTMCRFCVAQWWHNSKKSTCPECRQVWHGFPQINFTLRNTISTLFPDEHRIREEEIIHNEEYRKMVDMFNEHAKSNETPPPNTTNFNWSSACIFVAISIAVAVVISVAVRKFSGTSQNDILSKSLQNWSPDDVGVWISELGPWSVGYSERFMQAGIDGSLLLHLKDEDLKAAPIQMTMSLHRRIFFEQLSIANSTTSCQPAGLWEYKERKSGMAIFIMFGIREFPRATLVYLYLFNYRDTFLPIFEGTVNLNDHPSEVFGKIKQPTYKDWMNFLPRWMFVPYYLVARFASHYLSINWWTSRVVMMHAVLMTLAEFTKARYFFTQQLRKLPYLAMKQLIYVTLLSIAIKVLWPFVPFFIAECIFYWLLYVSPFDALNRLRKRLYGRHQVNN